MNKRKTKAFLRIIVPIRNGGARFADGMYRRLCEQTFQDFHLVVIDDCSTDNTLEILKSLDRIDGFLTNPRQMFAGGSRNVGMQYFTDDAYTTFFDDDDDLCDNEVLQRIHDCAVANGMPDMIRMNYVVSDLLPDGSKRPSHTNRDFLKETTPETVCADLGAGAPWTKAVRTEKLKRFPECTNLDDCVQHIAVCDSIETVVVIPEPCYERMRRDGSVSIVRDKADCYVLLASLIRLRPTLKHEWAIATCDEYLRWETDMLH